MSQAKVDQYKVEKANRRQTIAKEKRNRLITKMVAGVIGLGLFAWIAVSTVDFVKENLPVETYYCDVTAVGEYLDSLDK